MALFEFLDFVFGQRHPEPFIVVSENAKQFTLKSGSSLRDISPTLLGMLGVDEPKEMTGTDLRVPVKTK